MPSQPKISADANVTDAEATRAKDPRAKAAGGKSAATASSPAAAPAVIEVTAPAGAKPPRRARSKRFRRDRVRYALVGEDITAPVLLASAGRLRIRSERAAEVARWFGLRKADDAEPPTDSAARTGDV